MAEERRKRVLLVLFIPSTDRSGRPFGRQQGWVDEGLRTLGTLFGGATAYPKAHGVWRDDERGGTLVFDEPVIVHSYTTPDDIQDESKLRLVARFCRRMGRETNQGEVGLLVSDEYIAITQFDEE